MGFRFKSEELVVPMRLSAFNKGELRNVVYLLTDGPRKIRAIPEEYVVRQVSGIDLLTCNAPVATSDYWWNGKKTFRNIVESNL